MISLIFEKMFKTEYKYSDVTEKIIGCAMKVHSWFGPGFPEIIYQRSLLIELEKARLKCKAGVDKEMKIAQLLNFGAPSLQFKRFVF